MTKLKAMTLEFLKDDSGATAVEYGLILGLMVIAIVGAISSTGTATSGAMQDAADSYPT